ncbi:MAG: signal peptidase [Chloroflexota bacterium]|jgi:signal peptidase I|nr:signal peptidase [Chloroflexota bacterium]
MHAHEARPARAPVVWTQRNAGRAAAGSLVVRRWHTRAEVRGRARLLLEIVETVVLTVLVAVLIQTSVAQPYRVEQTSMQETLEDGQMVLVDKLTPRFEGYRRGDIVVFTPPADDGQIPFIKRVIGVPGDVVELAAGLVLVNGVALDESGYVFQGQRTDPINGERRWDVPDGMLFVLGDHRGNSTDSRSTRVGLVPLTSVIGRAVVRYWPLARLGLLSPPSYSTGPQAASVP